MFKNSTNPPVELLRCFRKVAANVLRVYFSCGKTQNQVSD